VAAEWENHVPKIQPHIRLLFQRGGVIAGLATVAVGGGGRRLRRPGLAVRPRGRATAHGGGTHAALKASNPI
jgi:hypothetical protein